jgi:hypothetical protein
VWLAGLNLGANPSSIDARIGVVVLDQSTLVETGTRWYSLNTTGWGHGEHTPDIVCTTTNSVFMSYQDSYPYESYATVTLSDQGQLVLGAAVFIGPIDESHEPHLAATHDGGYAFVTDVTNHGGYYEAYFSAGACSGGLNLPANWLGVWPVYVPPDICQAANGRIITSFGWISPSCQPLSIYAPPMAVSLASDKRGLVVGLQADGYLQAWAKNGWLLGGPQQLPWLNIQLGQGNPWPWTFTGHMVALSDRDGGVVAVGGWAYTINERGKIVGQPWPIIGESIWISHDGHTLLTCVGGTVAKYVR